MNSRDASGELHDAVTRFCESAEHVDGVQRVNLKGDGNLGGCDIYFEDDHKHDKIEVWGGHQFKSDVVWAIDEIDADTLDDDASRISPEDRDATRYGPVELEITIDGQKQTSTFGWRTEADGNWQAKGMPGQDNIVASGESTLEWADNPEPGVLQVREDYIDDGPTVDIDIR